MMIKLEGQLRVCNEFAERNGYRVIHNYIDRAVSGKTDKREQFQQMLKDSTNKFFEYVIVYKLDRFARNRYDSAINKALLKKNGIKVLSACEQITDSPEGIILEAMIEGYEHSNGHNKNQIWIETVYIRCKSKAEFVKRIPLFH